MSKSRPQVDLPPDAYEKIKERRGGLREVVDDDGAFSSHAQRLLALIENIEEVNGKSRR